MNSLDDKRLMLKSDDPWLESLAGFVSFCCSDAVKAMGQCDIKKVSTPHHSEQRVAEDTEVFYILLASDDIRLTIRMLYDEKIIRSMLANQSGKPETKIPIELTRDLCRELCNLSAGMVQRKLRHDFELWISLPFYRSVFEDPAFAKQKVGAQIPRYFWQVETQFGSLKFSLDAVVYTTQGFHSPNFKDILAREEEDTFMF